MTQTAELRASANRQRYEYVISRGHREYAQIAIRNMNFYLGDGGHWTDAARRLMKESGRKTFEQNEIFSAVNGAVGYQISNRMDMSFVPRGHGADDVTADLLGKIIRQVNDANSLHDKETDLFRDGMVQRRGYYDIRQCFDDSVLGKTEVGVLDPVDVIPDPDATTYDPEEGWSEVTIRRWFTVDEIGDYWGKDKRQAVINFKPADIDGQSWDDYLQRARIGNNQIAGNFQEALDEDPDTARYLVIDRQYKVYEMTDVMVWPTGEMKPLMKDVPEEKIAAWRADGAIQSKRRIKRVKWLISTAGVVLFDDYSPYPFYTIVPFFPYFMHGHMRGMVDNAVSPQEMLNKSITTGVDIFNRGAKGGWQGEQGILTNMTDKELSQKGSQSGLVLIRKVGTKPFEPIEPPRMPEAINNFIAQSMAAIKSVTANSEELNAENSDGMSGIAIQARQYAAQQKLAIPLSNLQRTRNMLAKKLIWFVQEYMTAPQVLRITEKDVTGKMSTSELPVNQEQDDGSILNDLTIGDYDVVISEQPLNVTFDNSQFEQIQAIAEIAAKQGETIPIKYLLRYSNLADKQDIIEDLEQQQQQKAQQPPPPLDPLSQAKADLAKAQTELSQAKSQTEQLQQQLMNAQVIKTANEGVQAGVVAIYSATQAAAEVAAMPQVAGIADEILGSAGFKDQNAPPIISLPGGGTIAAPAQPGAGLSNVAPPVPTIASPPQGSNTDPVTPPDATSPAIGADRGIEKPGVQ